jgi:uncharacterized protein
MPSEAHAIAGWEEHQTRVATPAALPYDAAMTQRKTHRYPLRTMKSNAQITTANHTPHVWGAATQGLAKRLIAMTLLLLAWGGAAHADVAQFDLPRIELSAGMHRIHAQVASTGPTREIGLMHRSSMPANEGMLFVFERPDMVCFWMKNTLIPLSAAFIDDNARIVNIVDMQPNTTEPHCTQAPVRLVLEMNQGWFKQRGIGPGSAISGLR